MLLLLDSSGNYLVAGLAEAGGHVVARAAHRSGTPESRNLSAVVDALLESAGRPALTGVVAGTGPGTFIGTRMAVSYANGLAAAAGISLAGVNSLAAVAAASPAGTAVVRDARQEQVYCHIGRGVEQSTSLVPAGSLRDLLREARVGSVVIESARPEDPKAAARIAAIAATLSGGVAVSYIEMVPLEGLLRCAGTAESRGYIEPEYIKGFL